MSAYLLVLRESPVHDAEAIAEYSRINQENAATMREHFNLQPLAVYGQVEALEGKAPDGALVLKFETMEKAKAWYNSKEYQQSLPYRLKGAEWRVILVDGLD